MSADQAEVGGLLARALAEVVRQRPLALRVDAPDDGIADDEEIAMLGAQAGEALVEPVVLLQLERDAVVGFEREFLELLPQRRRGGDKRDREQTETEPLRTVQADAVGKRDA